MFSDEENPVILPEGVTRRTEAGCIEIFENIMTKEVSDRLVSIFNDSDANKLCPQKYSNATIGDERSDGGDYRSNSVMTIEGHYDILGNLCQCGINEAEEFLREIFTACVNYYQLKYEVDIETDEGFQLLKYGPGKEYKAHSDAGPGFDSRIVSGIIYLNPWGYDGGGTHFINYGLNLKTDVPSIALFPSNYAYIHRARAVLSGTKYAIVTWMWPPLHHIQENNYV